MTEDVSRHYDKLLARHYSWMFGGSFADNVAAQRTLLETYLPVAFPKRGQAVDLGAGSGFQSAALADMGFSPVIAIDGCADLLDELNANRDGRPIVTVHDDICLVSSLVPDVGISLAVCMGDTLPHLPDAETVRRLFADILGVLQVDGLLVLTFRDQSAPLDGIDRFLPVRSDDNRIMTCFLEYGPETIVVHDLIYLREGRAWHLYKSAYRKLRLKAPAVADWLTTAGYEIIINEPAGRMQIIIARRNR